MNSSFSLKPLSALILMLSLTVPVFAQDSQPKQAKPTMVHVTEGCEACAALLAYLKSAGVKLDNKKAEKSKYPLFPTVDYSDGQNDHGERIYGRDAAMPKSVRVFTCQSGG